MTENPTEPPVDEHRLIAAFALTRIFPMIDEYIVTRKLKTSVESGLLVLLAQRMVYQGHSPDLVATLAADAASVAKATLTGDPIPEALEELPPSPPRADNVLPFRPRQKDR